MILKQRNRKQLWSNSYERVSFGLGLGLLLISVVGLWICASWRHNLMVTRCMALYGMDFVPNACSSTHGFASWVAASLEGLPFVGAVVLLLLGAGFAFFRERLELRSNEERGDAFFFLLCGALGATFVPLVLMGAVTLISQS